MITPRQENDIEAIVREHAALLIADTFTDYEFSTWLRSRLQEWVEAKAKKIKAMGRIEGCACIKKYMCVAHYNAVKSADAAQLVRESLKE